MSFSARRERGIGYWLRRAFWEEQWCVGLVEDQSFWECAANGTLADQAVRWLPTDGRYFFADPCWLSEKDRTFVAERFDYRRRIGSLVLAEVSDGRAVPRRSIKLNGVHHSYPMVYASEGRIIIIPESAHGDHVSAIQVTEHGEVLDEFPILGGRGFVDPTVFAHDGSFWMFANPLDDFDDKLVVFRGDSLTGPWIETSFSPLTIPDCRGAGKVFERSGSLIWPTQSNRERYGGGVIFRRILSLSDREMKHDVLSTVVPDPRGSRPLGFHSFSKGEQLHLVDGLRYAFSPLKPLNVMIARYRRRRRSTASTATEVPTRPGLAKG